MPCVRMGHIVDGNSLPKQRDLRVRRRLLVVKCATVERERMVDEVFLTTEEVLAYLKVNLRTVYRLIKAGKIPAVRVGRQWRFR